MYQIVAHLCRFALKKVIHPRGTCCNADANLAKNHLSLCLWGGSKRPYKPKKDDNAKYDFKFLY